MSENKDSILTPNPTEVVIKLKQEQAVSIKQIDGVDTAVPDKAPDGSISYITNDIISLQNLLSKFNTTKRNVREWAPWAGVKEKLYRCYAKMRLDLHLSTREAGFLRDFLEELPEREGKSVPIREGEVRTRESILEQLYRFNLGKKKMKT